jgi:hypothetical protein
LPQLQNRQTRKEDAKASSPTATSPAYIAGQINQERIYGFVTTGNRLIKFCFAI